MSETFLNAPLVEIVAELRWPAPHLSAKDTSGNAIEVPLVDASAIQPFFLRISGAVAKHGFDRPESLMPQGVVFPHQMIYRYRRSDDEPVLVQVGPGQFSINALSPYKSWDQFRPWLEKGIEALLESMDVAPRFTASLRYIDAFRHDLTDGREALAFLTEMLGFQLSLPPSLADKQGNGQPARAALQVIVPSDGMQLAVSASDGKFGGDDAVLMDTTVQVDGELAASKDAILPALDKARGLIHGTFVALTGSIRDRMQPATIKG